MHINKIFCYTHQLYVILSVTYIPPLATFGILLKSDWKGLGSMLVLLFLLPTYIVFKSANSSLFMVYGIVVCIYSISS